MARTISDWSGDRLRDRKRWQYGVPPAANGSVAWAQPIVRMAASGRGAVLVLGEIRKIPGCAESFKRP